MNESLLVSALIVTRLNPAGVVEILNVLAINKDKYGFPGGKLDKGETPQDSVIRETEEELGQKPYDVEYIGVYKALTPEDLPMEMHVFTGKVSREMKPTNEIAELHWLTHQQMSQNKDLLTPMTIKHILPLLEDIS